MSQQRKMKVCELSGHHEENGSPAKPLSLALFTVTMTAESLLDKQDD